MNPIVIDTRWRPDGKPVITVRMFGGVSKSVEVSTQDLEDLRELVDRAIQNSKDLKF